jgi:O-antigen/teichoic acid export membrane protein
MKQAETRGVSAPGQERDQSSLAHRARMLAGIAITRLAGPSGAALVSRGGQTVLAVVLARTLGVGGYGLFVFALGTAVLAGMFAGFGWPNVVNREMPRLIRERSWELLRGVNRAADACTATLALLIAGGLFASSFEFPGFATGLRMAALLSAPIALVLLRQQQLVGVDRPSLGMMLDQGMAATLVLLIVVLHPMGPAGTLTAYAAVTVALVVVASAVFRARLPEQARSATPRYRLREWLASGAGMFGSMLSRIFATRLDALLVAPFAGLAEAGLFGSAFRLTLLMTFPQFILQSLVTPRFSRAFAAGDLARVRYLYRLTFAFATLTALPFLLPALLVPEWVMQKLFGPGFAPGGAALFWLAIGQFVAAFGVSLNTMIAMGGDHKAMGRQGIAIAALTIIGGFFAVRSHGAVGAAIILMFSNFLWVAGMAWLARPLLRDSMADN